MSGSAIVHWTGETFGQVSGGVGDPRRTGAEMCRDCAPGNRPPPLCRLGRVV